MSDRIIERELYEKLTRQSHYDKQIDETTGNYSKILERGAREKENQAEMGAISSNLVERFKNLKQQFEMVRKGDVETIRTLEDLDRQDEFFSKEEYNLDEFLDELERYAKQNEARVFLSKLGAAPHKIVYNSRKIGFRAERISSVKNQDREFTFLNILPDNFRFVISLSLDSEGREFNTTLLKNVCDMHDRIRDRKFLARDVKVLHYLETHESYPQKEATIRAVLNGSSLMYDSRPICKLSSYDSSTGTVRLDNGLQIGIDDSSGIGLERALQLLSKAENEMDISELTDLLKLFGENTESAKKALGRVKTLVFIDNGKTYKVGIDGISNGEEGSLRIDFNLLSVILKHDRSEENLEVLKNMCLRYDRIKKKRITADDFVNLCILQTKFGQKLFKLEENAKKFRIEIEIRGSKKTFSIDELNIKDNKVNVGGLIASLDEASIENALKDRAILDSEDISTDELATVIWNHKDNLTDLVSRLKSKSRIIVTRDDKKGAVKEFKEAVSSTDENNQGVRVLGISFKEWTDIIWLNPQSQLLENSRILEDIIPKFTLITSKLIKVKDLAWLIEQNRNNIPGLVSKLNSISNRKIYTQEPKNASGILQRTELIEQEATIRSRENEQSVENKVVRYLKLTFRDWPIPVNLLVEENSGDRNINILNMTLPLFSIIEKNEMSTQQFVWLIDHFYNSISSFVPKMKGKERVISASGKKATLESMRVASGSTLNDADADAQCLEIKFVEWPAPIRLSLGENNENDNLNTLNELIPITESFANKLLLVDDLIKLHEFYTTRQAVSARLAFFRGIRATNPGLSTYSSDRHPLYIIFYGYDKDRNTGQGSSSVRVNDKRAAFRVEESDEIILVVSEFRDNKEAEKAKKPFYEKELELDKAKINEYIGEHYLKTVGESPADLFRTIEHHRGMSTTDMRGKLAGGEGTLVKFKGNESRIVDIVRINSNVWSGESDKFYVRFDTMPKDVWATDVNGFALAIVIGPTTTLDEKWNDFFEKEIAPKYGNAKDKYLALIDSDDNAPKAKNKILLDQNFIKSLVNWKDSGIDEEMAKRLFWIKSYLNKGLFRVLSDKQVKQIKEITG